MLTIGDHILLLREQRGLTQAQFARLTGVPQPNLSNIEKGKQDITVGTLRRLAQALDVPITYFFEEPTLSSQWTRERLEQVAQAIAGHKRSLTSSDREIVKYFQAILPSTRGPKLIRQTHAAWISLRRTLDRVTIQNILERVRDAQSRQKRDAA